MFGILFRAEIKLEDQEDFINFIKWDIQVAKEREPGTLRFDLFRDPDPKAENAFFVYEAYRDEKAFEEHQKNEPFQRWDLDIKRRMLKSPHQEWFKRDAVCSLAMTTDGERAFRTKDYELKVSYLTGQFTRMWQRFQFFVALQTALVGGKTVFGDKATMPLAIVGAVISAAWFIIGAEDRYLVRVYRNQTNAAGQELSRSVPLGADDTQSFEPVGWLRTRSKELEKNLAERPALERFTEWRCEPISITRLPCWLALLALAGWLAVLMAHLQ